jgi:hypothetical protein
LWLPRCRLPSCVGRPDLPNEADVAQNHGRSSIQLIPHITPFRPNPCPLWGRCTAYRADPPGRFPVSLIAARPVRGIARVGRFLPIALKLPEAAWLWLRTISPNPRLGEPGLGVGPYRLRQPALQVVFDSPVDSISNTILINGRQQGI